MNSRVAIFVLALHVGLIIEGCNGQKIVSKNLNMEIVKSNELKGDTLLFSFQVKKAEKIEIIYITFGYVSVKDCHLYREVYDIKRLSANKKGLICNIKQDYVVFKIYYPQSDLNLFNYARLNFSNDKGEYSKELYYKDSEKLDKVKAPCKEGSVGSGM